jgi:diguanylate cyclase (GGDEF)-like protein
MLIADDEPISRLLLGTTLRNLGHEVMDVSDGRLAFDELSREDGPRLAILDWMMPELDGLEVCRRLRERHGPYVYLILLTARSAQEDLVAAFDAGFDDFLVKPFDTSELRARLRSGIRVLDLQEDLLRAQQALLKLASHDHLTGILNRRTVTEFLEMELARSRRENSAFSILMVDIDQFKPINDTHGHPVGDEALSVVVQRMRIALRSHDAIGRYGGDEFLVVLPGCDADTAEQIATRLRTEVSMRPMTLGALTLDLRVSVGITTATTDTESAEALITRADTALYDAKKRGRDRVAVSPAASYADGPR